MLQVEESLEMSALPCEQKAKILSDLNNLVEDTSSEKSKTALIREKETEKRNCHFEGLMDMTRMEVSQQRGRYIVATRDIQVNILMASWA